VADGEIVETAELAIAAPEIETLDLPVERIEHDRARAEADRDGRTLWLPQ
jgi:hypothetical protein